MATQTRRPSGEGSVQNIPSAGTNWSCVSDESDSTYVYVEGTNNAIDIYTYSAFDFSGTSINKLSCYIRIKDTGSNAYVYVGSLIINGSYYYGDVEYGAADWADYTSDWLTNPETSAAWTIDELNGIGVGGIDTWRLRTYGGNAGVTMYVSEYALIADYEEAGGTDYPLEIASGAVTIAGTAVVLKAARKMASASGAVTTDGTATGLLAKRIMASAAGAVTTDGTATGLLADRIMASVSGAVTSDGTAIGLLADRIMASGAGAVTTDGTAIGLFRGKGLVTSAGAVTADGAAVGLLATRLMGAIAGNVAATGTAVALQADRKIAALVGAVTIDGVPVGLIADREFIASAGAVTIDGVPVGLIADRLLASASGAVTAAGTDVVLQADRKLATSAGAVTVAGNDIALWLMIILGDYPDLVTAARHRLYVPETLCDRIAFTVEVTSGDFIATREIDLLCGVVAGQDKTVERNALVCPFFDALFSIDSDLISAVNYKVDSGSKTAIPAAYGTALTDRVRSFSLSFSSAGEKRVTLYVTDNHSNEYSDSLIVRVS